MFHYTSPLQLSNGLQLHVCKDNSFPVVSTALILDIGSKDELPEQHGWAHLCEHLLFTGTNQVPDFDKALSQYGGMSNAWTSCDATVLFCSGPKNILELIFFLESERIQNIHHTLHKSNFSSEKNVVLNEYSEQVIDIPFGKFLESQEGRFFGSSHPYGHSVIGSRKTIRKCTYKGIRSFLKKYQNLRNAHLLIVGDVCIEDVERYTKQYFDHFPQMENTPLQCPDFDQNSNIYIEKGKQTQNMLRLDWRLPESDSNTISMFEAIANWLESDAGPLYQELASKKGWSNEIICEVEKKRHALSFSISIYFSSEQSYEEIQSCVLSHIYELDSIPIKKCEMQLQRNILSGLEHFDSRCEYLASLLETGQNLEEVLQKVHHFTLQPERFMECMAIIKSGKPMVMVGQSNL